MLSSLTDNYYSIADWSKFTSPIQETVGNIHRMLRNKPGDTRRDLPGLWRMKHGVRIASHVTSTAVVV